MIPIENQTLRELIRGRPLAIGILEELTGGSFWGQLDTDMPTFCRVAKLDLNLIKRRLAELPANTDRQDWRELPLFFVVDHLTEDHKKFRGKDIPGVHRLLDGLRQDLPDSQRELDALIAEFKEFRQAFTWHMDEEEEFIFPKIIRTEASLRHPDLYPEVFKGSIRMFSQIQLHGPEESFHVLVTGLSDRLRGIVPDIAQAPAIRNALDAMQAFEARLRAHTRIESEILFRRAIEMEDTLLRRVA